MDIFVGSLPFKLKESQLRELFEQFGEVSTVTIVINKATRQNKGYGFVEMPDEKAALKAIHDLNGKEVLGRAIIVSKSDKNAGTQKEVRQSKHRFAEKSPSTKGSFSKGDSNWKKK